MKHKYSDTRFEEIEPGEDRLIVFSEQMKELLYSTLPSIGFFMIIQMQQVITLSHLTQKSEEEGMKHISKAFGLANSYTNAFLSIFISRMVTGFEVQGAAAKAEEDSYLIGVYMNRSRVIVLVFVGILLGIHFFVADNIIRASISEENIQREVANYIYTFFLLIILEAQYRINIMFLFLANKLKICCVFVAFSLFMHSLFCNYFIGSFKCGLSSVAIAEICTVSVNLLFTTILMFWYTDTRRCLIVPDRQCFKGWNTYFKIVVPAAGLAISEQWSVELISLIALCLEDNAYSTHLILRSLYMVSISIKQACGRSISYLVSSSLARGNYFKAKYLLFLLTAFMVYIMIFAGFLEFTFNGAVMCFYTNDERIIRKGELILPIIVLLRIFSILCHLFQCFLRGSGRGLHGMGIMFFFYYVVQNYLCYYLAITKDKGVYGLWIGRLVVSCLAFLAYLTYYFNMDGESLIRACSDKIIYEKKKLIKNMDWIELIE